MRLTCRDEEIIGSHIDAIQAVLHRQVVAVVFVADEQVQLEFYCPSVWAAPLISALRSMKDGVFSVEAPERPEST